MNKKELTKKFNRLLQDVDSMKIYDGRGKGVNQYQCEECGAIFYTRYGDKGFTPFMIRCRNNKCDGFMVHNDTLSNAHASCMRLDVVSWVRPDLHEFLLMKPALQEHVLNGGLVLETELQTNLSK